MVRVKIEPESDEESSSPYHSWPPIPLPLPPPPSPPHQVVRRQVARRETVISQLSPRGESKPSLGNRFDDSATASSDDTESYCVSGEGEHSRSSSSNEDNESWLSTGESSPDDNETVDFKNEIEKIIHHHYRKPGFKTFLKVKWKGYRITTWESLDFVYRYSDDSALKNYVRGLCDSAKATLARRSPLVAKYLRTRKSTSKSNNSRSNE